MVVKVTLLGASGLVGYRLYKALSNKLPIYGNYLVSGTHFSNPILGTDYLDITDAAELRNYVISEQPDVIVLVAGNKNVCACEDEIDLALRLNVIPVETLCDCIAKGAKKTRLLYLSSDHVFDGRIGWYSSNSRVSPDTNYGRSKVIAENRLLRGDVDATILRTAAVLALEGGFLGWFLGELRKSREISLFGNSYFSPTPVELLADCLVTTLLDSTRELPKILHAVGECRMSRYELGGLIREMVLHQNTSIELSDLKSESLAARKDLSMIPNVNPMRNNPAENTLMHRYLKEELSACTD